MAPRGRARTTIATINERNDQLAPRRLSGPTIFALAYLCFFVVTATWSLATPLFASPDEPDQVIKAVAVAHGEFLGRSATREISPHIVVTVPASFVSGVHLPTRFVQHRNLPATCEPPLAQSTAPLRVSIYVGRYPPLYYAIVGIPSWFSDGSGSVYAMRLVSAALCSLFLALAATAVLCWSRRKIALIGIALAATPQVLFLSGMVNPNSLEIAAGVCCWVALLLLALGRDAPPKALVVIAVAAASVEVCCRSLSPLWVAISIGVAALLAGPRRAAALCRVREVQIGAVVLAVATVLALAWTVHFHSGEVQTVTGAAAHAIKIPYARALLDRQHLYLQETIGDFGVLNVPSPGLTYLLLEIAALVVAAAMLIATRWTRRLVYLLVWVLALAVPFVIVLSQAHSHDGLIWQGRDGAPLTLAVVLVAAVLLGERERPGVFDRAVGVAVTVLVAIAGVGAFAGSLNRYTVGFDHPFDFFSNVVWEPPLGAVTVFVLGALAITLGAGAAAVEIAWDRDDPRLPALTDGVVPDLPT